MLLNNTNEFVSSASFLAPSGIANFPVVAVRLLKPILLNRLFAQEDVGMAKELLFLLLSIRALAVAIAIEVLTTPPRLRKFSRNVLT